MQIPNARSRSVLHDISTVLKKREPVQQTYTVLQSVSIGNFQKKEQGAGIYGDKSKRERLKLHVLFVE